MKWKIVDLKVEVEKLLKDVGFPEELFILRTGTDFVCVMFDSKGAVDYFRVDFENSMLSDDCVYEYKADGKRHCAYIYSW